MHELWRKKEHCSKPTDFEIKSRKPFKPSLYSPQLMKNAGADMAWWHHWSFLLPGSNWAKTLNSVCKAAADWSRICLKEIGIYYSVRNLLAKQDFLKVVYVIKRKNTGDQQRESVFHGSLPLWFLFSGFQSSAEEPTMSALALMNPNLSECLIMPQTAWLFGGKMVFLFCYCCPAQCNEWWEHRARDASICFPPDHFLSGLFCSLKLSTQNTR